MSDKSVEVGPLSISDGTGLVLGTISPTENIGLTGKQGELLGHTFAEVSEILGFDPNKPDDPDKVDGGKSWAFSYYNTVDGTTEYLNIWSWKGSGLLNYDPYFSYSGSFDVMTSIFGEKYIR